MAILTRRWVFVTLGVIAVATVFVLVMREAPVDVELGVVEAHRLEVVVEEDGRTRALDRYVITSPVAGRLERVTLREGATLAAGDEVARIQPLPIDAPTRAQLEAQLEGGSARLSAAQSALEQARSASEQAARELERRMALAADSTFPIERLEQYRLAASVSEQARASAEAAAGAAAADVEGIRAALMSVEGGPGSVISLRAPAKSVIFRVPERSERVVGPGEPLMELGDRGALEAVVDVLTTDAVRIRAGMPAELTGWGGDTLHAAVRYVEPSAFTRISALGVEEQRVNVVLDLAEHPVELGDGFRVDARILVWAQDNVLTVPLAALFREAQGWWAFVEEEGRAVLRSVQIGQRGTDRAQVLGGLSAGERVVLFPPDGLADGAPVRGRQD